MRPLQYPLLADENIGPEVVAGLRTRGCDVRTVADEGLIGQADRAVLERAASQARIVVTHDLAFGRHAIQSGAPFVGIVYLRPGHISAAFVLGVVDALRDGGPDVEPPFVVVAERRGTAVRLRVRNAPPW
jgi:predicted nuclease of predicted toxin-antitoxin system